MQAYLPVSHPVSTGGVTRRSAPGQLCGLALLSPDPVDLSSPRWSPPLQRSAASALPEGSHMPRAEKKSHWIFLHFPFDFAQSQVSTFGLDSSLYKNQTRDEPQKQDTQANKRSPLLSEEVPYQITLIRKHSSKCTYIRIKRGTNHRNKTRREQEVTPLSEEVPYQITCQ